MERTCKELERTNPAAAKQTRESYALGIREGNKQWAGQRKMEGHASSEAGGTVAELEAELAALDEEGRREPALLLHGGVRGGRIVASGLARKGESGDPLVSVHPDLYDRRRPAAVQVVSYKTSDAGIKNFPTIQRIAAALREKVTVPMLEAFLDDR
jgi:hypothetical protein